MASTSTATRRRSAAALIALVAAVFVASAAGTVVVARRGAVFNRGVTVTRIGAVAPFSRYGAVVVRGARHLLQAKAPAKAPAQMAKAPAQIAKATTPAAGCKTVLQVLDATPELSLLKSVAAIVSEPLKKEFGGSGQQFTLFAPTNAAIEVLLKNLGSDVASNTTLATTLLSYHIVPGAAAFSTSLKNGQNLETGLSARGSPVPPLKVRLAGGSVIIDAVGSDAAVVKADVAVCRGVVHIIDTVLLPVDYSGGAAAASPSASAAAV